MASEWPSSVVKQKDSGTVYGAVKTLRSGGRGSSGGNQYKFTGYYGVATIGNEQFIVPLWTKMFKDGPYGALVNSGGTPVTYEQHLDYVYQEELKVGAGGNAAKPVYYYKGKPYTWDGRTYAYGNSSYIGIDKTFWNYDPTAAGAKYFFDGTRRLSVYRGTFVKKSAGSKNAHLQRYGSSSSSGSQAVYQDNDLSQLDIDADARLESAKTAARRAMDTIAIGSPVLAQGTRDAYFASQSLKTAAENALRSAGYTNAMIEWYFDPGNQFPDQTVFTGASGNNTRGNGGGTSGTNSASPAREQIAPTPAITRVTIRAPFGYAAPPEKAPDARPQLVQNYKSYERDPSVDEGYKETKKQAVFYFPYVPSQIQYSGLGSEWVDIPRQGNFPIVEWSNWNLMEVSMEFLIAEDRQENGGATVPDGIFNSVSRRIQTLREMAQRQAPISVFNLDDMFRVQLLRSQKTGKPMQFVISDVQITALRRSQNSVEKEITAAQVDLSLREIPIETITLVKMSPPKFTEDTPKKKKDDSDDDTGQTKYTDTFNFFW